MAVTTQMKRRAEMARQPLPNCHGGIGSLDWIRVLDGADTAFSRVNFIHDDILAPGVSIGLHRHHDDVEYYYILAGRGTMTLDGEAFAVTAGDITAVFPGGEHALVNDSDADLRILVISVS